MVFIKDLSRLEYVWIDADGELRSKSKTIRNENHRKLTLQDITVWNFDGSSTGQASGNNSEVYLRPVKLYIDPFREESDYLVLCDTWLSDMRTPHPTNTRYSADVISNKVAKIHFY